MIKLLLSRIIPGVLAVGLFSAILIALQVRHADLPIEGVLGWFETMWEQISVFFSWLAGHGGDVFKPRDIFYPLPDTLRLAGFSLLTSFIWAAIVASMELRWPYRSWVNWPGKGLRFLSFFPAIILGYILVMVLIAHIGEGRFVLSGPTRNVSDTALIAISVLLLSLGNGVFQDIKDGIIEDYRRIIREEHILASRARGETIVFSVLRALVVPMLSRAMEKLPVFVGASIPFEFFFDIKGVGKAAWNIIDRWRNTDDGTVFPLILLVGMLGAILVVSSITSDVMRLAIDPRQRGDLDGDV